VHGTEAALHSLELSAQRPIRRGDSRRTIMNWDQVEGQWKQMKGHVKSKWAKLTDDDVDNAAGKRDVLIGSVQQRYGLLKEHAEKQVDAWIAKFSTVGDAKGSDKKDSPS
jgi:uncharacterized protein YjbJ (UPF0337 family)